MAQNNQGILSMLDEECLRPGLVTDDTFLRKLSDTFQGHPHLETRLQQQKANMTDHTLPFDAFRSNEINFKAAIGWCMLRRHFVSSD